MIIKQIFKDDPLLPKFFDTCQSKGYHNNISVKSIKFDYFEHSAFFALIQNDTIKSFSGIHNFEYDNKKFYRIGFRCVTLYDENFKVRASKDLFKSSIQYSLMFPLQILYAKRNFPQAPFILTTNTSANEKDTAGKSQIIDKKFRQSIHRLPGMSILYDSINYLYTDQTVWSIDENVFLSKFEDNKKNFNVEILV